MWKSQVIKKEQKGNEQTGFLYIVDPVPILQTKNSNILQKSSLWAIYSYIQCTTIKIIIPCCPLSTTMFKAINSYFIASV